MHARWAGGVSTAPGNAIINNGGAFYNDETLQTQVSENSTLLVDHIDNDEDVDGTNELSNLVLDGNVITLSNPLDPTNQIDLTPILGGTGSGSNNSTFEVINGNLSITDAGGTLSVPLTDLNTDADTHLGNTNLTQTGGNRTYDLNGQNLSFSGTGNVGIGTSLPQEKVHVAGNLRVDGQFLDSTGDAGGLGEVLSATGTGTNWISASTASSPYHAVGKMNEASITKATNVFLVSALGTGEYRVLFNIPASSANYVIQLNLLNTGAASIEVVSQSATAFTVRLHNSSGIPIDGSWFFTTIDF